MPSDGSSGGRRAAVQLVDILLLVDLGGRSIIAEQRYDAAFGRAGADRAHAVQGFLQLIEALDQDTKVPGAIGGRWA